jgi:hypothetical protein
VQLTRACVLHPAQTCRLTYVTRRLKRFSVAPVCFPPCRFVALVHLSTSLFAFHRANLLHWSIYPLHFLLSTVPICCTGPLIHATFCFPLCQLVALVYSPTVLFAILFTVHGGESGHPRRRAAEPAHGAHRRHRRQHRLHVQGTAAAAAAAAAVELTAFARHAHASLPCGHVCCGGSAI